jgi:ubiquitin-protein ligase E3 C
MTPDSKNSAGTGKTGHAILFMFVVSLSHILIVTDDIELHDMGSPLPLHQIRRCILLLKNLLYRACCLDDTTSPSISFPTNHFGLSLIASSSKLMRDLHDRSSRRALCVPKLWLFENLLEDDIRRSQSYEDYCIVLDSPVLKVCPFLVSFKRRLKLFEKIVTSNRESIQGRNDGFSARPGVSVNITRGRVLEDGLIHLNKLGRKLRQRIIVQYINETGAREAGLDAGGLFKEFWTDLSALSFNLNYALFCETESEYTNVKSQVLYYLLFFDVCTLTITWLYLYFFILQNYRGLYVSKS